MKGIIVALSCGVYSVNANNQIYRVPAKGSFRNKSIKPVVGDYVEIDDGLVISKVYDRVSFLKRPTISNIDQMLIVESLVQPEFSFLLAFKYLTYANMNNIKAKIVLTKVDIVKDASIVEQIKNAFNPMDIETYFVSNKSKIGLDEVRKLFEGHVTCLIGQSGVGKSSLINSIDPDYGRSIGEYSSALGRGKHQTKEVILLPYQKGFIADTPGFSSLDLELFKEDLAVFYPGFTELYTNCYFSNCLHITENKCEVKKAIKEGKISKIAYECYIKLSCESIFRKERYSK